MKKLIVLVSFIASVVYVNLLAKSHDENLAKYLNSLEEEYYLDSSENENEDLDTIPQIQEEIKKRERKWEVTITVYHPVEGQCDSDPLITADMSKIDLKKLRSGQIRWIAVSRDLLGDFKYGEKVYVESDDERVSGIYEIHDTMNKRFKNYIDILTLPGILKGKWEGTIKKIEEI